MARIYNITSTQETNIVEYVAYDYAHGTLVTETLNLKLDSDVTVYLKEGGYLPYELIKDCLNRIRKYDVFAVDVKSYKVDVQLYGMTEDTFMQIAKKIEPTDRRNLITRTIKNVSARYQAFNMSEGKVVEGNYTIPDSVNSKDDSKVLAYLRKTLETDTLKILAVIGKTDINALYGVDSETFIKNSVILDKETRKPITEENE